MISTGRKISFPPARISSFFQNYFYLILIMVSTSSKIALTKKILFPRGTRSCFNSWMKDIEKYVATIWKSCFYFKTFLKKLLSNGSSLRIDFPLISIIVSASRKNLRKMKKKWFPLARKFVSPSRNKLSLAWVFFKKLDSS